MLRSLRARMTTGSAIALLALSFVASPVSAAPSTARWVDDNAGGNGGPAACATAAYTSIQDAIDASSAGDWVYVCPGTYTEQLVIPAGVKVRARPLLHATLVAPTGGTGNVVELTGDHAQVRGLKIEIDTIALPPALGPSFQPCAQYDTAILARGNNDSVRNNHIKAVGSGTLSGPCGYDYGIVIGAHGDSATARVTFNWVTDFKRGGILVEDTDSYAFVRRNTIKFYHLNDCPITRLTVCLPAVAPSVNDSFLQAFGIGVESQAKADIFRNWVGSGPDACSTGPSYSCSPTSTPTLSDGISMTGLDSSEITNVGNNVVKRTTAGIVTRAFADGAVIHDNWVYTSHYGYWPLGDNDEWHHNHTSGNDIGIDATGSGNNVHDNDFRGNLGFDCFDGSTGTETDHTANTWTNDLGNSRFPNGICIPDAP